jgi:hypothetical protein
MFGQWLKTHLGERALEAGRRELGRFVAGLRAMSDEDLGALVAIATVLRVNFESHDVIPEDVFSADDMPSVERLGAYQMRVNKLIRQFERMQKPDDAAGAIVWSYSLRALNVPGLRDLGRDMWGQLRRGFPYVEAALDRAEAERDDPFPARVRESWRIIPTGLEPPDEPEPESNED